MKKIYTTIARNIIDKIRADLEDRKGLGFEDYLIDNNNVYELIERWEKLITEELEEMII